MTSQASNLVNDALNLLEKATVSSGGVTQAVGDCDEKASETLAKLPRQRPSRRPLGGKSQQDAEEENAARLANRERLQQDLLRAKDELEKLAPEVEEAGEAVKQAKIALKAEGKKLAKKDPRLTKLLALKKRENALNARIESILEEKDAEKNVKRTGISKVATRNFIYTPSAEIHGAVGGLWDYGPTGSALKANWIRQWRNWFVIEEDMLEVDCAVLTPYNVLKTSGHVDKFEDLMVKDLKTGGCFRADHLLEEHIDKLIESNPNFTEAEKIEHLRIRGEADAYAPDDLTAVLQKYGVKSPEGNGISKCYPFNLMFGTQIGPTGKFKGYLRPETAQGIFVNFRKLLEYNNDKMPFAAAQIGLSFRNEIAPRAGLLRVREFQQAEIEHFCEPDVTTKEHPRFHEVKDLQMSLLPAANQTGEDKIITMTIGEACAQGMVSQTTLGYYMARTALFMEFIGIKMDKLRFRQHRADEMAHYARDCWDVEIECSYGWVECVGIADRACFDLGNHARVTGIKMEARRIFKEAKVVEVVHRKINKKVVGKKYRKESKKVIAWINSQSDEDIKTWNDDLQKNGTNNLKNCDGEEFEISKDMFEIKLSTKNVQSEEYTPGVVEPSFGLGRIIYALLEHVFWKRNDERVVLSFRPLMAPIKVAVLPLGNKPSVTPIAIRIHRELKRLNVAARKDDSGASIGKKYARADEQGIPFDITIDFESDKDKSVTVRERDTGRQIRVPVSEVAYLLRDLALEEVSWDSAFKFYPEYKSVFSEE